MFEDYSVVRIGVSVNKSVDSSSDGCTNYWNVHEVRRVSQTVDDIQSKQDLLNIDE